MAPRQAGTPKDLTSDEEVELADEELEVPLELEDADDVVELVPLAAGIVELVPFR